MLGLKGNTPARHATRVGWTLFICWIMKRINKFPQRPRENKVRCKSRAIMSLNECFILLTVSSRKGNFLLTDKNENNVSWQPFTNVVTIYKVKLIFPPLMIKNTTFKPFGVWNRQNWKTEFQDKKKHMGSQSFEFGVLHLIRDKPHALHRIWIFRGVAIHIPCDSIRLCKCFLIIIT